MTTQEINEIIGKLEGLFDKMIQLKILENESRRLKIQEENGGKNFPSVFLTEGEKKVFIDAKKKNQETFQEIVRERSKISMFEFMGQVFNPEKELTFDQIKEEFKNNWKCQE